MIRSLPSPAVWRFAGPLALALQLSACGNSDGGVESMPDMDSGVGNLDASSGDDGATGADASQIADAASLTDGASDLGRDAAPSSDASLVDASATDASGPDAAHADGGGATEDVDAPCVDGDINFADAPGMSRDVLFDPATNAFVVTEGNRVRRVDEDGTSTTIMDTPTLGARRIALFGDYVVAHQGFDFFAPNEVLRHTRVDATSGTGVTMQTITAFGSVTAPIRIFDVWPIGDTEGAFYNAGNGEIGVFDRTSVPFTMGRSGELSFVPNLSAVFAAEGTLFLGTLNPDSTGKLIAMDISEGAPGFTSGFSPEIEWELPGFIQSMEIDRSTNTLYVTVASPHGIAAIDLDDPEADVLFQLNVPGETGGFQVSSRPVVGENFVAVVSQDHYGYARVTVYEPVTLRRIGYLVDEDRELPFEDSSGNNAGAFVAARGTTLWAARGDGADSDMLIDIGLCLP